MDSINANKQKNRPMNFKRYIRSYAIIIALLIIWIVFQALTGGTFLRIRNISNLFRQMAIVGVLSIGMSVCLIGGNFDLSVGSIVGFTGAIAAYLVTNAQTNSFVALLVAVLIGGLIGLWNGLWVSYAKIPAFIATLGSMLIFKGGLFIVTQGTTIPVNDSLFQTLGQGYVSKGVGYAISVGALIIYIAIDYINRKASRRYLLSKQEASKKTHIKQVLKYIAITIIVGLFTFLMNSYEGIPIAVLLLMFLVLLFSFLLQKTRVGRHIYAVGGNPRASKLSGINNSATVLITFITMGCLAGLAGVLTTSRLSAATPAAGSGLELDAIAASVIGGVSLAGGSGKVSNTIIGVMVMASLTNGMSLLNMNSDLQYIVKGLILILAVWFDVGMSKNKNA